MVNIKIAPVNYFKSVVGNDGLGWKDFVYKNKVNNILLKTYN